MTDFMVSESMTDWDGTPFFTLTLKEPSGLIATTSLRGHDLLFLRDSCEAFVGEPRDPWADAPWGDEPAKVQVLADGRGVLNLYRDGEVALSVPVSKESARKLSILCRAAEGRVWEQQTRQRQERRSEDRGTRGRSL